MKICPSHWNMIRSSVREYGMEHLGAKSGGQAVQDMVHDLEGTTTKDDFDPNMSHHWYWMNGALESGGLYLMGTNKDGSNESHYCPLCEFASHYNTFLDKEEIDKVSAQMQNYCKENGLL